MRVVMIALAACLFPAGLDAQPAPQPIPELVESGHEAMYRLRYAESRGIFTRLIAAYPDSPVGYGLMSIQAFNEMVMAAANPTLQPYGAPNPYATPKIFKSIDQEVRRFHAANDRLIEVTERILARDPENVEALYFRGLAEENLAAEAIVISNDKWDAVGPGRRAKALHEEVLELDPDFVDAQVSLAAYEYALATVDGFAAIVMKPIQWLGFFRGDKDKAFAMMDEVAGSGRYRSVDAEVLLSIMHAENGDPRRAVAILESLGRRYPESYLVDLNRAAIQELKLRDPEAALGTYETLLSSLSSKTPGLGEAEVRFLIGRTRFGLRQYEAARGALEAALTAPAGEAETRPMAYLYLGRADEALGRHERADQSYRRFVSLAGGMESLEEYVAAVRRTLR